jgi:hypothetical protein
VQPTSSAWRAAIFFMRPRRCAVFLTMS